MQKRQILTILVALVASVALWIYVVTVVNPEDTIEVSGIPVTFLGQDAIREDYGLIISAGQDATVRLRISGKRTELRQLNASNITVTVDMSNVRRARTYNANYNITYPANVNTGEISITERYPGTIAYTVERLEKKQVEVIGVFEGTPAEGYTVGTMSFDHDIIEVSGTEEDIAPISHALVTLSRTNLQNTVTELLDYQLINTDGTETSLDEVSTDVTQIEVTLPVSKLKQVPLHVGLLSGGGATDANAFVTIEPATITISGDASVVDGFNYCDLGNVDLSEVEDVGTFEFPIIIPNNSKNVSGEETATVTVELRGLSTKKIRVGSVEFIGESENLSTESLTSQLLVTLRGPAETVDQVNSNNIRAVADLTNYNQPGTYEVPVTIYVDGFPDVGVLEEKTISVRLTDADVASAQNPEENESGEDPSSAESG